MTPQEATDEIVRLHALLAATEEAESKRSEEWRRMVRDVVIDLGVHEDESDDPRVLRECLVRTRIGAASERQCAEARSVVLDLYSVTRPDGAPAHRFVVSVPTGDLGELRETARHMAAAFFLGARDAATIISSLADKDADKERAP